jgi:predicted permease
MNWRRFFHRDEADTEQRAELESYLDIATEENIARGMNPSEARAAAKRKLGNGIRIREEVYHMNSIEMVDCVARNARHGARMLGRNPLFAVVSILTLAIGIGANTAVFNVVDHVLLKPLPYPRAEELVSVQHSAPGAPGISDSSGDLRLSASMLFTYADHNRTFQKIGIWTTSTATLTGLGEPEEVRTIVLSEGVLEALEVQPIAGRWLSNADQKPGAPATVMLSYGYWQRRFGGDRSVIGRAIQVASMPREIVGVMPEGFRLVNAEADVFMPFQFNRAQLILPGFAFPAIARMRPGVTLEAANREIARLIPVWMSSWPAPPGVKPKNWERWRITPQLRPLKQDVVGRIQSGLWLVMGTIGMVLLIACANVANLLLVRADARQRELAVRAALGAGKGRIVWELLLESTMLGMLGGALGIGVGFGVLKLIVAIGPASLPRLNEIGMDALSYGFAFGISVVAGVLLGLIPAIKYGGPWLSAALRSEGRSVTRSRERHRAQDVLVVAQVALALVLLVCSGLMLRTFQALSSIDPGFTKPEMVETMRMAIPPALLPEPERVAQTYQEIARRIAEIPGVTSVGFASTVPADGLPSNWDSIAVEGRPAVAGEFNPMRRFKNVSPGFLETMGTRLVAGRSYEWTDLVNGRPVIVISENLARELFGNAASALGKRVGWTGAFREIIGVAQDVYDNGVQEPAPKIVYWPTFMFASGMPNVMRNVTFTARSARTGSAAFLREVDQAVWSVNSSLSIAQVQSMADIHNRSLSRISFTLAMLAIAGNMALVLGLIGLYGVLAYTVVQRRHEVGIRMALGAEPASVKRMFVGHGLGLTAIGVSVGLAAAAGLSTLMSSLLFGVQRFDPLTYGVTALLLIGAACVACYLPARRAAMVDPIETLRSE